METSITINAACRMCRLCIRNCPQNAIKIEEKQQLIDKTDWQGILVYAEYYENKIHPITFELIGIGRELAAKVDMPVYCLLIGHKLKNISQKFLEYGVDTVFVYDNERLKRFSADLYANVFEDLIKEIKPSVVLIGSTSIGRSLAPRISTRFKTGLTADCTRLKIKKNTDLIQIRPAFGGNIMAQIITAHTRPQFATVRYKVMNCAEKCEPHGNVINRNTSRQITTSSIDVLDIIPKEAAPSITDAEVLIVAGQGVAKKEDLELVKELANSLGGEYAVTRPLVEKGWADYTRQIGLSGRTVKPKLIITCGVSGAIQFTACMNSSEKIIAINKDKDALIFKIAHCAMIGDLYELLPPLVDKIKGISNYEI